MLPLFVKTIFTLGVVGGCLISAHANDKDSCIDVEVDGVRSPSYACLSQKLQPAAGPTGTDPRLSSEAIVNRPSNQLGTFNRAATAQRMGSNFGTSVYPQRPEMPTYHSPLVPNR